MNVRAIACAIVLASRVASAGEHPSVELEIDPCIGAPADEIRRVVAVELGALVDDGQDTNADRTRVTVACEDGAVTLRVDDPITGKSLTRAIELASTLPVARGRLVALAIVELVSASWTELELNPAPLVQPRGQRSSAAARDAALTAVLARTDQQLRSRLELAASGEKFLGGTVLLGGGGLRLARDWLDPIGWVADANVHHGSQTTSLGNVSTDVIDVGAVVVVHRAWDAWNVRVGGGVRGGAVELSGVAAPMASARGDRFWAPWVGVLAHGSVDVVVAHRFTIAATIECGEVVLPVGGLVGGQRVVAVDGTWVTASLGVGVFL